MASSPLPSPSSASSSSSSSSSSPNSRSRSPDSVGSDGTPVPKRRSARTSRPTRNRSPNVLSGKYIEGHSNKKDLVSRLRCVVQVLRKDDNLEASSSNDSAGGLNSLCQALVTCVAHKDKQVRLYTVSACMELFGIFAPDAPWNTHDTLEIFRQTIRQLANFAHTTSPTQSNFSEYFRILELLAQVKIGVLLVELSKADDTANNANQNGRESTNDDDDDDDDDKQYSAQALQVLCELFRTLLQSVRLEHPPEIAEMAQVTISGCLEEFYESLLLPIPLLDEILICIGQGPTVLVTNPQKAAERRTNRKQLPAHQVEQANPSYLLASAIVRKAVDRLTTPISTLLNGLLNNQERATNESSILTKPASGETLFDFTLAKPQQQNQLSQSDVWSIIYELHKIAPSILTTVIGNLTSFLSVPDVTQRILVVKLLGRLFVKSPKLTQHFRRCYRDWLERANDVNTKLRLVMLDFLLQLLPNHAADSELSQEAQQQLSKRLEDPATEVRLKCIHGLCDVAYSHRTAISLHLWKHLGTRLSSKFKQERKSALTGLAQIYYRHYTARSLADVQAGGDDCSLEIIQQALTGTRTSARAGVTRTNNNEGDDENGRYSWIPSQVLLCASWKDDAELRSRLWQVLDDLLLGSELPGSNKRWNPTARAVGLAMLLENLEPNSVKWLKQLMRERAKLQKTLGAYLDARTKLRSVRPGSEQALAVNAEAQDLLERIAALTSFNATTSNGQFHPTLQAFHAQKYKHIFRILSTIATPLHSQKARVRALEELPNLFKSEWTKVLVRRCAMGDFLNSEVLHHSILLAQEFCNEGDYDCCKKLLVAAELAADAFPELCGEKETFQLLVDLFVECRSARNSHNKNTAKIQADLVTTLSVIISKAAPCQDGVAVDENLKRCLLHLSCRDGTPEQARHAVSTMASLMGGSEAAFEPLLKSLTSPSRLTTNTKLVSIFAALSELAECAPRTMITTRGKKAVTFAMETVLLGRSHSGFDEDDDEDDLAELSDDSAQNKSMETPTGKGRQRKSKSRRTKTPERKHSSPTSACAFVEDETLSLSCRTICSSIEFLTSYIRSAVLASRGQSQQAGDMRELYPDRKLIETLFETLCQILRDHGMPPCSKDRRECQMRQDRTAIRTTSGLALLRLCDARLALDKRFLSPARWHTLSGVFLDDEKVCRDRMLLELGLMLTGNGKFGKCKGAGQAVIPSLRFFAFIVFCVDSEHGALHCGANGNAANVGKRSQNTKIEASEGAVFLRKAYEETSAQARARGPAAEEEFEKKMKTVLMPEYVVPYAFHLLSFRRETPSAVASAQGDDDYTDDVESQRRVLRKRLKWLFDPLVMSLGDSAGNISFLLRMVEILGKNFQPTMLPQKLEMSSRNLDSAQDGDKLDWKLQTSKLQAICSTAREVLLSYIKTDINLAPYPGSIQVPGHLFRRRLVRTAKGKVERVREARLPSREEEEASSKDESVASNGKESSGANASVQTKASRESFQKLSDQSAEGSIASRTRRSLGTTPSFDTQAQQDSGNGISRVNSRSPRVSAANTPTQGHVHFSPEVASKKFRRSPRGSSASFGGLSPIRTKQSLGGGETLLLGSDEETRGSTPPSLVNNARYSSSMGYEGGPTQISGSPFSGSSDARSTKLSASSRASNGKEDTSKSTPSPTAAKKPPLPAAKKRPSPDKEGPSPKRRKQSVPVQIKIVRKKLQDMSQSKRNTRRGRKAGGSDDDTLDFIETGDTSKKSAGESRGKKKQRSSKKANDVAVVGKENRRTPTRPRSQRAAARR